MFEDTDKNEQWNEGEAQFEQEPYQERQETDAPMKEGPPASWDEKAE